MSKSFLGSGWSYPLKVNPGGSIARSKGEYKIKESIMLILGTAPGERIMRPSFGADLHRLVFEPNNSVTANLAAHYVERALIMWEPRIQVNKVNVKNDIENGCLLIEVQYHIRTTNSPQNLVYPFFLHE